MGILMKIMSIERNKGEGKCVSLIRHPNGCFEVAYSNGNFTTYFPYGLLTEALEQFNKITKEFIHD
jgi:hypothetical protein